MQNKNNVLYVGNQISGSAKICPYCGSRQQSDDEMVCPRCGQYIPKDAGSGSFSYHHYCAAAGIIHQSGGVSDTIADQTNPIESDDGTNSSEILADQSNQTVSDSGTDRNRDKENSDVQDGSENRDTDAEALFHQRKEQIAHDAGFADGIASLTGAISVYTEKAGQAGESIWCQITFWRPMSCTY